MIHGLMHTLLLTPGATGLLAMYSVQSMIESSEMPTLLWAIKLTFQDRQETRHKTKGTKLCCDKILETKDQGALHESLNLPLYESISKSELWEL